MGTTRTTHTWDDENRLTQVAKTGMTTNVYTFNGDGQRVQIVDSQGTKKPIWDLQNILLETDGSNVTQVVYTLEPAGYGKLISQRRSSTSTYYLFDRLGSTRKLTGSTSAVTDSYDFKAYGETFASSGSTVNVFRWVGAWDSSVAIDLNLYFLWSGPFSPSQGRNLNAVVTFAGTNPYTPSGNNPIIAPFAIVVDPALIGRGLGRAPVRCVTAITAFSVAATYCVLAIASPPPFNFWAPSYCCLAASMLSHIFTWCEVANPSPIMNQIARLASTIDLMCGCVFGLQNVLRGGLPKLPTPTPTPGPKVPVLPGPQA
ncbi:MAG: hypothetical protein U0795_19640 [Pirellulales bacterium]